MRFPGVPAPLCGKVREGTAGFSIAELPQLGGRRVSCSVTISRAGKAGCIFFSETQGEDCLAATQFQKASQALETWLNDPRVEIVILESASENEGIFLDGDAHLLFEASRALKKEALDYIGAGYSLSHRIATYPKPILAVFGGRTRFFNTGLVMNAPIRLATEKTSLSFPETGFGFIPDAGSSFHLSRLAGEIGTWLSLTGARLEGEKIVAAGLASHFCHSTDLPRLKEKIVKNGICELAQLKTQSRLDAIKRDPVTNAAFAENCVKTIRKRLEKGSEWSKGLATKFCAKSPLSTRIALRQLRTAQFLSSATQALRIDYRIASRLIYTRNFREGIRAKYLDRDFCPRWRPVTVNAVTFDMVAQYFTPLHDQELRLPGSIQRQKNDPVIIAA